jgi:hypothetical protein
MDVLSIRVDSLKRRSEVNVATGALEDALRNGLVIGEKLQILETALDSVNAARRLVYGELRTAFDDEMALLIKLLGKAGTPELIGQLTDLQRRRDAIRRSHPEVGDDKGPMLFIRPDDGPVELRQKADLLADMAKKVEREARTTEKQLSRLFEEQRLRDRLSTFAGELDLFDEVLAEGRGVATAPTQKSESGNEGSTGETGLVGVLEGDRIAGLAPQPAEPVPSGSEVVTGREVSNSGRPDLPLAVGEGGLVTEITRLRMRQSILEKRRKDLLTQLDEFKSRLKHMIEEGK